MSLIFFNTFIHVAEVYLGGGIIILIYGSVFVICYVEDDILKRKTKYINSLLLFVIKSKPGPKLEI